MNRIKTEARSRLLTVNLGRLLNISLNTSDDTEEIDFNNAIDAWKNKKNRYFCRN